MIVLYLCVCSIYDDDDDDEATRESPETLRRGLCSYLGFEEIPRGDPKTNANNRKTTQRERVQRERERSKKKKKEKNKERITRKMTMKSFVSSSSFLSFSKPITSATKTITTNGRRKRRKTATRKRIIRANSIDELTGGTTVGVDDSLQRMIRATNELDRRFRSGLPFVDCSSEEGVVSVPLAKECEYENDVYAVRGKKEVASLMKHWSSSDDEKKKKSKFEFQFETLRSASVEPGSLLLQWKATWKPESAKKRKFTNTLLEKAKPSDSIVSLKKKMDRAVFLATEEELEKEKEDDPFGSVYIYGVTTYKVNGKGEIVRREDKVDWRFADNGTEEFKPKKSRNNRWSNRNQKSSSSSSSSKMSPERAESLQKLGYNAVSSSSSSKTEDGASGNDNDNNNNNNNNSWAGDEEADFYDDLEAKRMAEDIAATMFYNALSPPDVGEWSWFLDTVVELEYQSFTKAMGDESTGMLSKDEFVKYVLAVATFGFFVPTLLICYATWQIFTGGGMMGEDGGLSQAALDQMDPYDRAEYLSMREKEMNQQKKVQAGAVAGESAAAQSASPSLAAPPPQIQREQQQQQQQQQRATTDDDIPAWGTQVWLDIIRGRVGA